MRMCLTRYTVASTLLASPLYAQGTRITLHADTLAITSVDSARATPLRVLVSRSISTPGDTIFDTLVVRPPFLLPLPHQRFRLVIEAMGRDMEAVFVNDDAVRTTATRYRTTISLPLTLTRTAPHATITMRAPRLTTAVMP